MAARTDSRIRRRFQRATARGLARAYSRVQVDPREYLERIRRAHAVPIQSFR
jgi:hypothetical protein